MVKNDFTRYMMELIQFYNLTYKNFASILGISPAYLSDLINGNRMPTKNVIDRIINGFQLNKEEQRHLYDISASATGKLPLDVEEYLLNNPQVLASLIESMNASKDESIAR